MPFNLLTILVILFLQTTQLAAQNNKVVEKDTQVYKFRTALKGGYRLAYKTDDSLQYLYLKKGRLIRLVSTEDKQQPQQLLGIVAADFNRCFVLAHTLKTWYPEDPIEFELYEKKAPDTLLRGFYIDAAENSNVILFYNNAGKGMMLYNVVTGKTERFPFPEIDVNDDRLINRIRIKSITLKKLVITYIAHVDGGEVEQKYLR